MEIFFQRNNAQKMITRQHTPYRKQGFVYQIENRIPKLWQRHGKCNGKRGNNRQKEHFHCNGIYFKLSVIKNQFYRIIYE